MISQTVRNITPLVISAVGLAGGTAISYTQTDMMLQFLGAATCGLGAATTLIACRAAPARIDRKDLLFGAAIGAFVYLAT